jgi:hypothetical protein
MKNKKGSSAAFLFQIFITALLLSVTVIYVFYAVTVYRATHISKSDVNVFVNANDEATKLSSILKTKTGDLRYSEIFSCLSSGAQCDIDEDEISSIVNQMDTRIIIYQNDGTQRSFGERTSGDILQTEIALPNGGFAPIGIVLSSTGRTAVSAGPRGTFKWLWPVDTPMGAHISECFEDKRTKAGSGEKYEHIGIDIPMAKGKKVYSVDNGKVIYICDKDLEELGRERIEKGDRGNCNGFGNNVVIKNGDFYTHYVHLHRVRDTLRQGQEVKKGELIGFVGNTGYSFGYHLHFEVSSENPVTNRDKSVFMNPLCFYSDEYLDSEVEIKYKYTDSDNDCNPNMIVCDNMAVISHQSLVAGGL